MSSSEQLELLKEILDLIGAPKTKEIFRASEAIIGRASVSLSSAKSQFDDLKKLMDQFNDLMVQVNRFKLPEKQAKLIEEFEIELNFCETGLDNKLAELQTPKYGM